MNVNLKPIIAFSIGLIFSVAGIIVLEVWCQSQLKIKNPGPSGATHFIPVQDLKTMYPGGFYPDPPPEIPDNKRYHGPFFYNTITKHEHQYFSDLRFHKDSHRYLMKSEDGKILSDVNFYFDKYRRRITPGDASKKTAKYSLALLGDSNIVGYGVKEDETLAHYLSLRLPATKVYNYASPGMYPYEMMIQTEKLTKEELPEENGTVLYFFFSYHMLRNMGAIRELAQPYSYNRRVVDLNEQGDVVIKGTFKEEEPFWCWIAPYLRKSAIFRYFQLDLKPKEKDFKIETAIIRNMQKNVEARGLKFFVIIHPHQHAIEDTQTLVSYLHKEKIPFIYFGHWRMDRYMEGPATLVFDMHVSKYVNEKFADGLSQVLRNDLSVVK